MAFEWASPAAVGVLGVGSFFAWRQMTADIKDSLERLVTANREDHLILFKSLADEISKRSAEDNEIRQNYISWQKCQDCPARIVVKNERKPEHARGV